MRKPDYEAAKRAFEREFPCHCGPAFTERDRHASDCVFDESDAVVPIVDAAYPAPPDTEERLRFVMEMDRRGQELLAANPGEPEDWSDAAKLRLQALYLDKYDFDRGVYDRHSVQDDLRRMADRIEALGRVWWW